jgi:TM2 domain-containing membrane protein YozV
LLSNIKKKEHDGEYFMNTKKSRYRFTAVLLLCFILGMLGAHRFYVKKVGTGILMLLTLGGCLLWYLLDLALIFSGKFKDKQGNPVRY